MLFRSDDAPDCKLEQQIKDEQIAKGVERGRAALKEMQDMLNK